MSSIFVDPTVERGLVNAVLSGKTSPKSAGQRVIERFRQFESKSSVEQLTRGSKVITRSDYSAIATLKVAGRAIEKIAEMFGVPQERMHPHVTRAMALYRAGEVQVGQQEVQNEGEEIAGEKASAMRDYLAKGVEANQALLAGISGEGAAPSGGAAAAGFSYDSAVIAATSGYTPPPAVSVNLPVSGTATVPTSSTVAAVSSAAAVTSSVSVVV